VTEVNHVLETASRLAFFSSLLKHQWPSEDGVFDFYVTQDLPATAILDVFTQENAG
jgi:hypothetical protein